ncbi:GNAT family N-acetyltransferase [Alkalihalobacillus sp. TS-13]|uniref:GNAT family N-acetyltransferase n=1 Tax=Alkalihalobacillus sp. TS-13 TaxID=2842455 RepID=UPI0034D96575
MKRKAGGRESAIWRCAHLEEQIKLQGLKRIELGVFEFNKQAYKLYQKLGYQEIGRIKDFTYWNDKMWYDIRMEKYLD